MAGARRHRSVGSVKSELVKKSREAALAAVQTFNSPTITFKTETFIVLMVIAWTYLLHAFYRSEGVEYREYEMRGTRRHFLRTKHGAHRHWSLERCLAAADCPLDRDMCNNLKFLIGLRHEIEHQMTMSLDDSLSAKLQACCLNYNLLVKRLFGDTHAIDRQLSVSMQFSAISDPQREQLQGRPDLPANIGGYIADFENGLEEEEFQSQRYAYRVLYVAKTVNRKGQADSVIEFVHADSPLAEEVNARYEVIRETEKPKYLPMQVVDLMHAEGYPRFGIQDHTNLWKAEDAKREGNGFGTFVAGKVWHWYGSWVDRVRLYCRENADEYRLETESGVRPAPARPRGECQ